MKLYYPYPANNGKHKYYIITKTGKKVYFGQYGASDYTIHKDPLRKERYIKRHSGMNENWSNPNTAGYFSRWLLWEEPNIKDAYKKIKKDLLKKKYITKEQYNQYVF
jgi:hypothetical protein